MLKLGLDIGSTTAKLVALDKDGNIVFSKYQRHNAKIIETISEMLDLLQKEQGDAPVCIGITGSIGMGVSEKCSLPFVQEVSAAAKAASKISGKKIETMIDIGGEDAKVVFFNDKGEPQDLRMNGNCAGGTGAFIDQMGIILDESNDNLSKLALNAERYYPIASRCGVFCKTDIQNLIAKNVSKEDISASIFHAVAVQTCATLAHGYDIKPPVLFCGGPLTFLPALRKAFLDYLKLSEDDVIIPTEGSLFPAIGSAIAAPEADFTISSLEKTIREGLQKHGVLTSSIKPIFTGEEDYKMWKERISSSSNVKTGELKPGPQNVYLGIDSGSTTTKIVFLDEKRKMVFSYYHNNDGDPIGAVTEGLKQFDAKCKEIGAEPNIKAGCSTGYGEDLIKAAFRLDYGIIETIAHYLAASRMDPEVTFILDIGGQDMKAIYVDHGVINRIEINEACSSGCGSFIETFAKSLGYPVSDFAHLACQAKTPCDLGTRCTVFMNSKVKQVLREGYSVEDIAAGLSCSVVKNCLYKVLKINDVSSLGQHIVVQGGTMKNDSVVRALEVLSGAKVSRSDHPELMGAYGCAIYALSQSREEAAQN